ncbi:TetR/AcrR family transcriptional regulator [Nocardia sp. NPDC019395]|uniref:TetR/AcrR family transcriptional regulator n=1 Tax=Nocardia sp. NPDC019395 TaxID=3154686 RepID=UPI0034112380
MAVRSESSRQAILDATMDLLVRDRRRATTVQKLTIEMIAKRAKVSKATIYRWWPNKAAVVIDAFVESHLPQVRINEDLPVREALDTHVKALITRYAGPQGRLIAQIIAEGQYDPATLDDFRTRFWNDRYAAVDKLIRRGIDEGIFRSDINPGDAAEMIYAPIYFHLLIGVGPLDEALATRLVDQAIRGLAAQAAGNGE